MESDCSPSAAARALEPEVPAHSDQSSAPLENPSENRNMREDDEEAEKGKGEEDRGGTKFHSLATAHMRVSTADGMAFGAASTDEGARVVDLADDAAAKEPRADEVKKDEDQEASESGSTSGTRRPATPASGALFLRQRANESLPDHAHGEKHEGEDVEIDPRPNVPPRTAAVADEAITRRESVLDVMPVSGGGCAEEPQHGNEKEKYEQNHDQQNATHTTISKGVAEQTKREKEASERTPPDASRPHIASTHESNSYYTIESSRGGSIPQRREQRKSSVSKGLSTTNSSMTITDDYRDIGDANVEKGQRQRQRKGEGHHHQQHHQEEQGQHQQRDSHARLLGQEGVASIEVYKQSEATKNFWVNRLHLLRREVEAARLKAHMKRSIGDDNRESAELIKATTASQLEAERRRAEAHLNEKAEAIRRQREARRVAFKASLHQTVKVRLDGGRIMRAEAQQQRSIVQQLREEVLLSKKASREKVLEEKNKAAERRQKEREVRELKSSTLYAQRLTRLREKAEHNEQETRTLVEESGQLLEQLRQLSASDSSSPHHIDDLHHASV